MNPGRYIICLLTICFVFVSCSKEDGQKSFDYSKFKADNNSHQLCFDVSSDDKMLGAIALKATTTRIERRTIALPFETKKVYFNDQVVNTSYSQGGFTVFDFLTNNEKQWLFFSPIYRNTENRENGVIWLSEGLTREFIINFNGEYPNNELNKLLDSVSILGLLLPLKAETFRNKITPIDENDNYFKFNIEETKKTGDQSFRFKYMVQATIKQKGLLDFLLKFAGIFFIPFVQFLYLEKEPTEPRKIKIKKITLWGTIVLQLIIFSIVGYLGYSEFKNVGEFPVYELILLITGVIIEGFVLWMKNGK